jgi:large subunit ribosomal protein L25
MEEILLNAEKRTMMGKRVKQLRHQGFVPGVLYGHHIEPVSVQVEDRALREVLQAAGVNRLVTLTVPGLGEPKNVLVRDLQRDTISHVPLHVDFYEVVMTERLTAEVPIVLLGESPIVATGEGVLFEGMDTIEIECLPGDLPPQIELDISGLTAIDDTILVGQLQVSDAVDVLVDADEIVVKILPPAAEEIEEEVVVAEELEGEIEGEEAAETAEAEEGDEPEQAE